MWRWGVGRGFTWHSGMGGEKRGHRGRSGKAIERHDDGQSKQLKKAEIGSRQDEGRKKELKQSGALNVGHKIERSVREKKTEGAPREWERRIQAKPVNTLPWRR